MKNSLTYFLTIFTLFVFVTCDLNGENSQKETANKYIENVSKKVSDEDISSIINIITTLFETKNLPSLNIYIDFEALLSRGILKSDKILAKLGNISKVAESLKTNSAILDNIQNSFTYYDFVSQFTDNEGYKIIVFRGYGEGGLNYHEYVLGEIDGQVKIIDIFIVLTSNYLSTTLVDFSSEITKNTSENDETYTKNIKNLTNYIKDQEFELAHNEFNKIPRSFIDKSQLLEFLEIEILAQIDEDLYVEKVENYRIKYPELKSSVDLISLDYFFVKEYYDEALICLKNLKNKYPDDPIIDYYKGSVYSSLNDCKNAINFTFKSSQKAPHIQEIKDGLFVMYFECGMYKEGFEIADELIQSNYFTVSDVEFYLPYIYEDYESLPEYKEWALKTY